MSLFVYSCKRIYSPKFFNLMCKCRLHRFHLFKGFENNKTSFHKFLKEIASLNDSNWRSMAGHAKWQNIKHIKAEKDRQKAAVCTKYSRLVSLAVREKGPDPSINNKLANLLEEAKKNNVPLSTIENAMKIRNKKKLQQGSIEIVGPSGLFVLIEYETDNHSLLRHEIKSISKKYSANVLTTQGRWRGTFEQKGIIIATKQLDGQPLNIEKALDLAIEAGAEEVQQCEDNQNKFLEFLCAPDDLLQVKNQLEAFYELEEAYIGYLPHAKLQLNPEEAKLADKFISELGSIPDIIRIHENIE